jgi:PAS domain-containing protein
MVEARRWNFGKARKDIARYSIPSTKGVCILELIFDDQNKAVDYRYVEVNPAFGKITGRHDVVGKTLGESVPGHHDR